MAGTNPAFDPTTFRNAIHFAMNMGTSPTVELQPSFIFPPGEAQYFKNDVEVENPRLDRDGNPFDPDIVKVQAPGAVVSVSCAVEIVQANSDEVPVGNFRPVRAVVTLLDQEYVQVSGCRYMDYNGDRYQFGYSPEAMGLFSVGIHTMIFYAMQET